MAIWNTEDLGDKYCITIPRLAKRRDRFVEVWGENFATFIPGVDYQTEDVLSVAKGRGLTPYGSGKYLPTMAICLSHRNVWERVAEGKSERATVFEDDALPTGEPWVADDAALVRWYWYPPEQWIGAVCYTLTRGAARELLKLKEAIAPDWQLHEQGFTEIGNTKPIWSEANCSSYPPLTLDARDIRL